MRCIWPKASDTYLSNVIQRMERDLGKKAQGQFNQPFKAGKSLTPNQEARQCNARSNRMRQVFRVAPQVIIITPDCENTVRGRSAFERWRPRTHIGPGQLIRSRAGPGVFSCIRFTRRVCAPIIGAARSVSCSRAGIAGARAITFTASQWGKQQRRKQEHSKPFH